MAAKKEEKKPAVTQVSSEDRKKALEVALGKIEKDFGKGSVMKLGDAANKMLRAGRRWPAEGTHHRDLRAGILR